MRYLGERRLIMVEMRTKNCKRQQRKEGEEQKSFLRDRQYFVKI